MKTGTYTQMYVQLVFAVKNRDALLHKNIREKVFKYIGGILSELKHKSIITNGMADHVHILFGLNPSISISETVHAVKRSSSLFINNHNLVNQRFSWQNGYGGFTYSRSQLDSIYNYILGQEKHHDQKSFKDEYIDFLKKFRIEFDERFLFDFFG